MGGLVARRETFEQDFRDISSVKQLPLGTYAETADGKGYRYGLAGGTTLDPGKVTTNSAFASTVEDVNVAATVAAGVKEVVIDAGAAAITANSYADGYLTISDATGEGINYLVKGNSAVGSGGGELIVYLDDPIKVGLTVDVSKATLIKNPWSGLIIVPATDQADFPAGVPNVSITNAYYGWVQTKGVCSVWADETFARGAPLTFGTGSAGQVEAVDAAGEVQFGVAIEAAHGADDYPSVLLQID